MTLESRDVRKAFGGVVALDGATVSFRPGRVNALIGPNGSGKTTFFNCVTGMIRADSGRITYAGQDITRKAPHAIARAGVGRTFQLCRVFPRMSALDNVLAAVRPAGLAGGLRGARRRGEVDRAAAGSPGSASSTSPTSRPGTCPGASRSCSNWPAC